MRYSYSNEKCPELGTIEGILYEKDGPFGPLFYPDKKYHEAVVAAFGPRALNSLFVETPGVTVLPLK